MREKSLWSHLEQIDVLLVERKKFFSSNEKIIHWIEDANESFDSTCCALWEPVKQH